jgi:hypothetical protein
VGSGSWRPELLGEQRVSSVGQAAARPGACDRREKEAQRAGGRRSAGSWAGAWRGPGGPTCGAQSGARERAGAWCGSAEQSAVLARWRWGERRIGVLERLGSGARDRQVQEHGRRG